MKKLINQGGILFPSIVSQPRFRRRGRFDKFATHGIVFGISDSPFFNGGWVAVCDGYLSDGNFYNWQTDSFGTDAAAFDACAAFISSYEVWESANGFIGFRGEWFNAVGRAFFKNKIQF